MEEVRRERRGAALWLTINRESRRNALNEDVLKALRQGVEGAKIEDGIRAVVITGAGKVFCAGGDLKPDASGDPFRVDPAERGEIGTEVGYHARKPIRFRRRSQETAFLRPDCRPKTSAPAR